MYATRSVFNIASKRCGLALRRFIHVEKRLEELGIKLPPAPTPKANYNIVCHASGNMLYVSGHLPLMADGHLLTGAIGPDSSGGKSVEHGYQAARHAGLNIISTLKEQLGDLDRVDQVVKVNSCHLYSSNDSTKLDLTRPLEFTLPFNEHLIIGVWNCSVYH